MAAVSVCNLSFAYGSRAVLRNVDLTLLAGRVTGLLGPNGAGKTTLLKAIAGLLPSTGEVRYGEAALAALSARQRAAERAYVAQSVAHPFPYTVAEVVAMGRAYTQRWFSSPAAEEAVAAALAEVGFSTDPQRPFDTLSGGEQQQVLVARALLQGADILLLDEPVSHLDLRHRAAIVAALHRRARQGATVLWSLHDLNLAALACHEVAVLAGGQIVACGAPKEVLTAERVQAVWEVGMLVTERTHTEAPLFELDPKAWR